MLLRSLGNFKKNMLWITLVTDVSILDYVVLSCQNIPDAIRIFKNKQACKGSHAMLGTQL